MELIGHIVILAVTFYLLARIVDVFFIESLEIISKRLKLSSDVAGATFMALGSSAPEFFVSLFALFRPTEGQQAIGAGTIVGSAIFNILVIVGASALVKRAVLTWQPVLRDLLFYIFTIVILLLTFLDGKITLFDALIFVGMYIAYVFSFKVWKKFFPYEIVEEEEIHGHTEVDTSKNIINKYSDKILSLVFFDLKKRKNLFFINFIISIVLLAILSHGMVESAVGIAHIVGIPEVIIGLTILAAGTSIPDLLSSIIVAKKGKGDMAVANAVGSNTFDINIGLGLPWLIFILLHGKSIPVITENLESSIFLLFATVIALLFLLIAKKWEIGRYAGVLLIAGYVFYLLTQSGIINMTLCLNVFGAHCVNL